MCIHIDFVRNNSNPSFDKKIACTLETNSTHIEGMSCVVSRPMFSAIE